MSLTTNVHAYATAIETYLCYNMIMLHKEIMFSDFFLMGFLGFCLIDVKNVAYE